VRFKTPTVIQMEPIECGAASLSIILRYYGVYVTLNELRERCGVSRDGVKASDILNAAKFYDLATDIRILAEKKNENISSVLESLGKTILPCIAYWEFNHFLVIEGFNNKFVYLNDPATGPRRVSFEEFSNSFTGFILLLKPNENFVKRGHKSSLPLHIWEKLKGSRVGLVYIVIASLLLAIPGIVIPVFSKVFIDNILLDKYYDWFRPMVFIMLITICVQALMLWVEKSFLLRFYIKLYVGNTAKFIWHLLRLPVSFFNSYYVGDIVQRINANSIIAKVLTGETSTAIVSIITIMVYSVFLLLLVPFSLVAIVFCIAIISLLLFKLISRRLSDSSQRLQQEQSRLMGVSYNGLELMETIKAQGLENSFFARWAGLYTKTLNTEKKLTIITELMEIAPNVLVQFANIAILAVGVLYIINGQISIGGYLAFSLLTASFLLPLRTFHEVARNIKEAEASIDRVNDVFLYGVDKRFIISLEKNKLTPYQLTGKVEVKNITFGYNKLKPPLINNFNLNIAPGYRIAFVGSTGSGKSTLFNMISGYFWPWQGEVLFDGVPLNELSKETIKYSIGVVNQEIFLFEGTIFDNLTLWDSNISPKKAMEACRDACIDKIIEERGGLFAKVTEGGSNFSRGEQQRIEIARALLFNPTILLLDEAYASLDTETELQIDLNIRKRGCTAIIVAHRLSTIRDCDEIIVIDNGNIVERGTHKELLQLNGLYSTLVKKTI
jgi:ATP-binding cassette, subfamily C, bacterial